MDSSLSGDPPETVLDAFRATALPVPIAGGQGQTWRVGPIVLKPTAMPAETAWRAEVLATLPESPDFRVARPVRSVDHRWAVDGWEAWEWVPGRPDPRRHDEVVRAGLAFHQAIAHLPRPAFLDARDNPWAYADRVAWEELSVHASGRRLELLDPLLEARRPVGLTSQVVHGDLLGNVLFADGLPPAVIDWPPYWRPVPWASAVVVADALCWYGAPLSLLDRCTAVPDRYQMLVRALIFRIATHVTLVPSSFGREESDRYATVVAEVLSRAHSR